MTVIGPWQVQTFSLALALAILLSAAVALRHRPGRPGAVLDVCLLALATGLLTARCGHILLHAAHFAAVPSDILRLGSGGLEWHSALAGAPGRTVAGRALAPHRSARAAGRADAGAGAAGPGRLARLHGRRLWLRS